MPLMQETILFQVHDVDNCLWDVRDARATKHGFDLLFGHPAYTPLGSYMGGPPRLIATHPLRAFFEANRIACDGVLYDLPAGRSTLKRVRRRLGFHQRADAKAFWRSRIHDLDKLSTRQFAERHNVKFDLVSPHRFRLLGRRARPLGWWRTPETVALLKSTLTHRAVAAKLGIGTSQTFRLRQQLALESLPVAA